MLHSKDVNQHVHVVMLAVTQRRHTVSRCHLSFHHQLARVVRGSTHLLTPLIVFCLGGDSVLLHVLQM
jgi:hypothetical protein